MQKNALLDSNLAQVRHAAMQLQDALYTLAQSAMTETNPHVVAWVIAEHDRVNNIVRKVHRIIDPHAA